MQSVCGDAAVRRAPGGDTLSAAMFSGSGSHLPCMERVSADKVEHPGRPARTSSSRRARAAR